MSVEHLRVPAYTVETTRREFLRSTAAVTAAMFAAEATAAQVGHREDQELVDVNVSLGRWPVRRLPDDEPERLVAKLRARGVSQAWAGSLDGLLSKDIGGVNVRLAEDCGRYGRDLLLPFGSINPKLPGWEGELQRCVEVHQMRGVRLHPNYHGYRLEDPNFTRLLRLATDHHLIIQLALVMEDERMMHPLLRAEPVDTAPLAEIAKQTLGLRLVLINSLRTLRGESLRKLMLAGNISVEISMLEGVGGLSSLLEHVPVERVLFGSHAPVFYFESAGLKLSESILTPEQRHAVCHENARRLLA